MRKTLNFAECVLGLQKKVTLKTEHYNHYPKGLILHYAKFTLPVFAHNNICPYPVNEVSKI